MGGSKKKKTKQTSLCVCVGSTGNSCGCMIEDSVEGVYTSYILEVFLRLA